VARDSRADRRARREARAQSGAPPERRSQPTARPAAQAATSQAGRQIPGAGAKRFVGESVGELRKVEWPGQNQVLQGTVVVIIACIIIGGYLYFADQAFSKLVSKVLLGQ
jgi:preprotein translocase SecE subunit